MCESENREINLGMISQPQPEVIQSIKCMIVGDTKTGKTILFNRLLQQEIPTEYIPTVFDVVNKEVKVDEEEDDKSCCIPLNLSLWDSAGSHVFDNIRPISYAHTDCFIICFRHKERASFQNVDQRWLPEILTNGDGPRVPIILCENQLDIDEKNNKTEKDEHENNEMWETEVKELLEKIGTTAIYRHSNLQTQSSDKISILLRTMINLAYKKKLEDEKPPDPVWKFQIVNVFFAGDSGVGKSSLIQACLKKLGGSLNQVECQKSQQEFYHDIIKDGCEYFLRIREVANIDMDMSRSKHDREMFVYVLCYAINDPFSYQTVTAWSNEIEVRNHPQKVGLVFIANKVDLRETSGIVVPAADGEELASHVRAARFLECSAKEMENVSSIFPTIIDLVQNEQKLN